MTEIYLDPLAMLLTDLSKKTIEAINMVVTIEKLNDESEKNLIAAREASRSFFQELSTVEYAHSWANTQYCAEKLPGKLGGLLSAIYYEAFQLPALFASGRVTEFNAYVDFVGKLVLERKMWNLGAKSSEAYDRLYPIYRKYKEETLPYVVEADVLKNFGNELAPLERVYSSNSALTSVSLFKYGMEVSEYDETYFDYVVTQEVALDQQANIFVKSFKEGLVRNATKCGTRTAIRLEFTMGQEPFVEAVKQKLKKEGYTGYVSGVHRIPENRQAAFDHKFDDALLFDDAFEALSIKLYEEVMEKHKDKLHNYLGIMYVEAFGEPPFSPASKSCNLKMTPEQNELKQKFATERMLLREKYLPSEETSFCILGLPTSLAGEKLPEIFQATCRINAMANEDYEPVQQLVVDAADKGEYILVKGCGKNETDIRIALPKLEDAKGQSNFVNCVAEVNVPIGEIFTSPQLKGTDGLLHLPDIYLDGFQYFNLKLTFKDGMIVDYNCSNFESDQENRDFVMENLLYPHQTLPLGEFAIGTNTLAYVLSQKLDITRILPVLIVEKMGPHFAIGDTCFSHVEDVPFYNFLDGKEVIARDNEFCQKRNQNPEEGYTNVHTDITIPYDEIGLIAAITEEGRTIKIIENGRFVLEGTELLNEPFLEAAGEPLPPRPAPPTYQRIVRKPEEKAPVATVEEPVFQVTPEVEETSTTTESAVETVEITETPADMAGTPSIDSVEVMDETEPQEVVEEEAAIEEAVEVAAEEIVETVETVEIVETIELVVEEKPVEDVRTMEVIAPTPRSVEAADPFATIKHEPSPMETIAWTKPKAPIPVESPVAPPPPGSVEVAANAAEVIAAQTIRVEDIPVAPASPRVEAPAARPVDRMSGFRVPDALLEPVDKTPAPDAPKPAMEKPVYAPEAAPAPVKKSDVAEISPFFGDDIRIGMRNNQKNAMIPSPAPRIEVIPEPEIVESPREVEVERPAAAEVPVQDIQIPIETPVMKNNNTEPVSREAAKAELLKMLKKNK